MATISQITSMCRAGQIEEGYNVAKADLEAYPQDVWVHRAMGWALYYSIKKDVESNEHTKLLEHIDELKSLNLLDPIGDSMIYENVLFKIADFCKNHVAVTDFNTPSKLSALFEKIKDIKFKEGKGYSFLLQSILRFENWLEMADFFDWWNLDNLTQDDYTPYITERGQKIMTVAERAFIANSKALLRLGDIGRIEEFLPKLDELMENHPEMMYPGYFYGKLLLALGSDTEEALKVVIPFARKKATEFWVWQLISDVYANDPKKQLACLLRAVHCKTKEDFLGKVRIKLAEIYIRQNKFDYAKHHIDAVTRCYMSKGWKLPYQVDFWIHQPWLTTVNSNPNNPIDFESITNDILCIGTKEAIAIVSYFDDNSHKASLVFGIKQKMSQKLRIKVKIGDCLKINYITDKEGKVKILNTIKVSVPQELEYAKFIDATIDKRDDKPFAFLKGSHDKVFIAPNIVQKFNLHNGDVVNCLAVYDYDKKKNSWNWVGINFVNK